MRRASNDNAAPSKGDRVIGATLANTAVVEDHITSGLQKMLKASGVSPKVCKAVSEFVAPAVALLGETERTVIDYVRAPGITPLAATQTVEIFDRVIQRLEEFGADLLVAARTNEAIRPLADTFGQFVSDMGQAWALPMAHEIEEPELER